MTDHSLMKLGKLPPVFDSRTLRLAKYVDLAAIPPAPKSRSWVGGIKAFGAMLNDQLGDCAIADPGHQIQIWSAANGKEITVPDLAILAAYEAVSGYNPADPNTDRGCVMVDVLNYWRKTGIGGHIIAAYADIAPKHTPMVKTALNLFGGLSVGVALPISAQTQSTWKVVRGPNSAPGSWGGHAICIVAYDATYLTCVTWGKLLRMTWGFFNTYCDEAHAVLSADWAVPGKVAPSGFNLSALQADLSAVTA
jgi:hypothetical protein